MTEQETPQTEEKTMTTDEEIEAILSDDNPLHPGEKFPPLGARSLLSKANEVYRQRFVPLVILHVLCSAPAILVTFFLPDQTHLGIVLGHVLAVTALAATVTLVRGARHNENISIGEALQSIKPRALPLFLFILITGGLAIGLEWLENPQDIPMVVLIAAVGLLTFAGFRFSLSLAIIMEEGLQPFRALWKAMFSPGTAPMVAFDPPMENPSGPGCFS